MIDFKKLLEKPTMIKRLYNDCETTGTDPNKNGLVQFSGVIVIDGKEVESFDLHMQPFPDDEITDESLEKTGLTRAQLFSSDRQKPLDAHRDLVAILAKHCNKYNKSDKFFFIGFNSKFDFDFIHAWFKKCGDDFCGSWFWFPPLCVAVLAGYLNQKNRHEFTNFKLETVFEALLPERAKEIKALAAGGNEGWHDALFDIRCTIEIEQELRRRFAKGMTQPAQQTLFQKEDV